MRALPSSTNRSWPRGWLCQAVRAPASKRRRVTPTPGVSITTVFPVKRASSPGCWASGVQTADIARSRASEQKSMILCIVSPVPTFNFALSTSLLSFCGALRRRGAGKQAAPVWKPDAQYIRGRRSIARQPAVDDENGADRKIFLPPPLSVQRIDAARFERPIHDLAVGALHVEVDPRVRVRPQHPCDCSCQFDWLGLVEFSRERMMRHRSTR